jgi:hypothetical protein
MKAAVNWTEPIPVQGTTVTVAFLSDVEPSAEQRVRDVLDAGRSDWNRFFRFAATSGP